MEIKDQIRVRREQLGMSVQELAKRCNVSNQSVRHWESGRSFPGKRHVPDLERALSVKLDFSPGVHTDFPTAESTLQAKDIEMFLKFSRLPLEAKVAVSRLIDVILLMGSKATLEDLGAVVNDAKHSSGRSPRAAAR